METIPDIATIIGYQNVEYFYRKFKKYTKVTPGHYREYYQGRNEVGK